MKTITKIKITTNIMQQIYPTHESQSSPEFRGDVELFGPCNGT